MESDEAEASRARCARVARGGTYRPRGRRRSRRPAPWAKKMLASRSARAASRRRSVPARSPRPSIAPHRPIARARSRGSVNTLVSSDRVAGNTIAAPTPITARAAISPPGLSVSPPTRLDSPKTDQTGEQHALAPEAVGQAAGGQHAARQTTGCNASTTHWSCALDASSSRTRVGSATLTIVVSRLITNAASSSENKIKGFLLIAGLRRVLARLDACTKRYLLDASYSTRRYLHHASYRSPKRLRRGVSTVSSPLLQVTCLKQVVRIFFLQC